MSYKDVKLATNKLISGVVWKGGVFKDNLNPPRRSFEIDGCLIQKNDFILVKDQKDKTQNGIYKVTRMTDGIAFKLTQRVNLKMRTKFVAHVTGGSRNKGTHWEMLKPTVRASVIDFRRFTFSEEEDDFDADELKNLIKDEVIDELGDYLDERDEQMASELSNASKALHDRSIEKLSKLDNDFEKLSKELQADLDKEKLEMVTTQNKRHKDLLDEIQEEEKRLLAKLDINKDNLIKYIDDKFVTLQVEVDSQHVKDMEYINSELGKVNQKLEDKLTLMDVKYSDMKTGIDKTLIEIKSELKAELKLDIQNELHTILKDQVGKEMQDFLTKRLSNAQIKI